MQSHQRVSLLRNGAVTIPADFFGQSFHRWPWQEGRPAGGGVAAGSGSSVAAAPTYAYGSVRSHDWGWNNGAHWAKVNTADGVYFWDYLDEWVNHFWALGKTLTYTLYGTPAWLSSSGEVDMYGYAGGRHPPTNFSKVGTFIAALMARYGTKIKYVEAWNEPDSEGFWRGSKADIAAITRQLALNAGSAQVIGPALVGGPQGQFPDWLLAPDGAGGVMKDHLQAVSYHTYHGVPRGWKLPFVGGAPNYIGIHITALKASLVSAGLSPDFPVINCEHGYDVPEKVDEDNRAIGDALGRFFKRCALEHAAAGFKQYQVYSHDSGFGGRPEVNPVLSAHLNDIGTMLPGKTMLSLDVVPGNRYRAKFSDGTGVEW